MPIYEYRCSECGFQKEFLQKVSDPALTQCPECGKASFSKMVTAAGFQLKGTGWYVTDFRNGSGSSATATKKSDDTKSDAGTTDTAAKSETKSGDAGAAASPAPSKPDSTPAT